MPDDARKVYEAMFKMAGQVDKSLLTATRDVKNLFKSLDQAAGITDKNVLKATSNLSKMASVASRLQARAREVGTAWAQAGSKIHQAFAPLHRLLSGIGRLSGIAGLVGGAVGGFEITQLIGEGSNVAAERETIRTQVHTLLRNMGKANLTDDLLMQMRNYADMESVFHYKPVANAAAQMLISKYKPAEILPEIRKLGELAKDDETLSLVADIYSQGKNMGYVTKGLLTRLQKDAKVPIYSALLQAMGQPDNLASESDLFKRLRSPQKNPVPWEFMEKALNILTGPGGALHGHQIEQLMTFAGQKSSVDERIKDAEEGIGRIFNKFVYPWMRMINQLKPATILGWFSQIEPPVLKFGDDLRSAFKILTDTGQFQKFGNELIVLLGNIGGTLGEVFGVKGGSAIDIIVGSFKKLNETLDWINKHFQEIKAAAEAFVAIWVTAKVATISVAIAQAIGLVRDGLVGLRAAASAAGMAMEGLAASEVAAEAPAATLLATLTGIAGIVAGSVWLARYVEADSRKHAADIIEEGKKREAKGGKVEGQYNPDNFPDTPAMRELIEQHKKGASSQKAVNDSLSTANQALAQLTYATRGAANALAFLRPGGGTMGNFPISGVGSMQDQTEYGPGVDWPGHGTPDADSARGIGHIHGKAYSLNGYPSGYAAAMKAAYAEGHYHIKPGDEYISEKDKKKHRWLDTSGARNPKNEDFYKGAQINFAPVFHITGPNPEETARVVQRRIQDSLPDMLRRANDEMSMGAFA